MVLERIGSSDTLVKEIIAQLSQAIIDGDFKPGDKLPSEAELCETLGVGRNSLREAIRMLNAMGVVETKRGQGTFLQNTISHDVFNPLIFRLILEPKSTSDIYELRVMIESIIVIMAIQNATNEEILTIKKLIDKTDELIQLGNASIEELVNLDVEFHMAVVKSVHNSLIEAIMENIILMFKPSMKRVMMQKEGLHSCKKNHSAILKLIEKRDVNQVFTIVESTLRGSFNIPSARQSLGGGEGKPVIQS